MNHRQKKKFYKKWGHRKYKDARIDITYHVVREIASNDFGIRTWIVCRPDWTLINNFKRFYDISILVNGRRVDVTDKVYQKLRSPLNI